jgi:hypothetical protein
LDNSLNAIFQQLGELIQGVRGLSDIIELRYEQVDKLNELVRTDLSLLRSDHRDLEEKLEAVIAGVQRDLGVVRSGTSASAGAIDALTRAVHELRAPVAEMVALRSRLAGLVLGLGAILGALVWLADPIYQWLLQREFLKP